MKLTTTKIAELSLDPSNVRKHSRRNLDAIKASLRKFGQQKPIVVDAKGIVLAGNGTLTAAQELGWTEIQIVRTELAGVEATAFAIADNRTAELAEWEEDKLSQVLQSLKVEDADLLAATGYDAAEVDKMSKAEVTEDEVPEPPAEPITKPGDLWILGEHRVLCGDSTKAEDVERLLSGTVPRMMVTDPPYGVEYDASWRDGYGGEFGDGKAVNSGKVANDDRADWREAWAFFAGDVAYVWHGEKQLVDMGSQLHEAGFLTRNLIVWAKPSLTFGRGNYHSQHETCWYAVRKSGTGHWAGDCKQTTLWQIAGMNPAGRGKAGEGDAKTGHGTQKPVECMARPMRNHDAPEVYDPFLGSGTTLIAAEQLGRKCYGMEISPAYCDVIVKRWENLTGKKAVLDKPTT
jgi:DNA modification methylase